MRFEVLETPFERAAIASLESELPLQEALDEMKSETPAPVLDVSDAEKCEVIKQVIDDVGCALATDGTLSDEQKLAEWVDILNWGVEVLPEGYEKQKAMLKNAIANPYHSDYVAKFATGTKL